MPALKAVLFDGGNTLLDLDYPWLTKLARRLGAADPTPEAIGRAGARLMRQRSLRYGRTPARQDAQAVFEESFSAIAAELGLSPMAAAEFARRAHLEDREHPQGLWRCPAPGALATLSALRARNLHLGVISNSGGKVEAHLGLAGLADYLDLVIDSSQVGVEKPDPAIFRLALAQLGLSSHEAVYVGDLLDIDCAGARGAGLTPYLYDPYDVYPDVEEQRVRALRELLDHF